jgi:hypothetical protein
MCGPSAAANLAVTGPFSATGTRRFTLNRLLKLLRRHGWTLSGRFFAHLVKRNQGRAFIRQYNVPPGVILPDPVAPMHDPDQRNELRTIVLDEKDIAIAYFERGRVAHLHGVTIHCASQHSQSDLVARSAFKSILNLEGHIAYDAPLRPFANPLRTHARDGALEDDLGAADQLVKRRWNNRSS